MESTLGWRVARLMGVDEESAVTERVEVATSAAVTLLGAGLGAIGAALA